MKYRQDNIELEVPGYTPGPLAEYSNYIGTIQFAQMHPSTQHTSAAGDANLNSHSKGTQLSCL